MALAKRIVLLGWNFACKLLLAKLADSLRVFLINALEPEIRVPLGGGHGAQNPWNFFFFKGRVFLGQSTLRRYLIDKRKKLPYLVVLEGFEQRRALHF